MDVKNSHSSCSANFEIRTTDWETKRKKESESSHGIGIHCDNIYWCQINRWWMSHMIRHSVKVPDQRSCSLQTLLLGSVKNVCRSFNHCSCPISLGSLSLINSNFSSLSRAAATTFPLTDTKPINFLVQQRLLESPGLEMNYFTHTNQSKVTLRVLRGATYISQWTNTESFPCVCGDCWLLASLF